MACENLLLMFCSSTRHAARVECGVRYVVISIRCSTVVVFYAHYFLVTMAAYADYGLYDRTLNFKLVLKSSTPGQINVRVN